MAHLLNFGEKNNSFCTRNQSRAARLCIRPKKGRAAEGEERMASRVALLILLHGAAALRTETTLTLAPESNSTVECGEACSCPSRCSGNGECFAGKCKCFLGYTYYDCSLRA